MRAFKDMIVRRRPSDETDEGAENDIFLAEAQAARSFVPRPDKACYGEMSSDVAEVAADMDGEDGDEGFAIPPRDDAPERAGTVPAADGKGPKIWEMNLDLIDPEIAHMPAAAEPTISPLTPTPPSPSRVRSDRVKTRLLGFHSESTEADVFAKEPTRSAADGPNFPVGWLVIVDGPGRGASFTLTPGLSTIGRDTDQTVTLDFGDTSISRERHASIAYDADENCTYVGHGGKSNIVKLNGKPLVTTEELQDGSTLKIGKTLLRYHACCTPDFSWSDEADD